MHDTHSAPSSLPPVEAVRDGDRYTLAIPRADRGFSLRVNGETVPGGEWNRPALLTVAGLPRVEAFREVRVRTRYRSLEDGRPDMAPGAWEDEDARLIARSRRDADGTVSWPETADEIAHARHRRSYSAESRTEWVKHGDVVLAVSDKVPEEPFMVPERMLGGDYMGALVAYDRPGFMQDWLRRRLEGAGMTVDASLGGLPRGTYKVFDLSGEITLHMPGGFHRKVRAHRVKESYAAVRRMRDADEAMLRGWVSAWFANISRPVNAVEVGGELRAVREALVRLGVRSTAAGERNGLLRRLDAVIAKVEGQDPEAEAAPPAPEDAPAPVRPRSM